MNINEAENINTDISAEENKTQYKGLLKATGLFGGVQGLNMLTALIRNKLTAVILGTSGFGLISVYNSATTMLGNATNFGLPISAVRNLSDINKENDYEKSARYVGVVRSWILLTSLLGLLVCIVLSTQLSLWTFGDKDYTRAFYFLSVMVAATTYAAGELAILKAVRQMREIALVSVYSVLGSLFIVVPIYYFMGESGVIPALLVLSLWILAVTLRYSLKHFPFRSEERRVGKEC